MKTDWMKMLSIVGAVFPCFVFFGDMDKQSKEMGIFKRLKFGCRGEKVLNRISSGLLCDDAVLVMICIVHT